MEEAASRCELQPLYVQLASFSSLYKILPVEQFRQWFAEVVDSSD